VYLETFSNQPIAYGIMGAPGIITQPMSQTIVSGQSATLSTVVTGQAPLSYQWYRGSSGDNQNPVSVNADSFNTPPLAVDTRYWVRASNPLGYVDSATALVATARLIFLPLLAN
jgi:Ig-like domain CHU_C associated